MTLPAEDATNTVVTADILRTELQTLRGEFRAEFAQIRSEMADCAEMWRAFWIFGTGIVAALGVIVAVVNALG